MSGAQHRTEGAGEGADVTSGAAAASGGTASIGAGPGAISAASDEAASTARTGSPAPLTSLTSLLGGAFEGGTTCTTDGACD